MESYFVQFLNMDRIERLYRSIILIDSIDSEESNIEPQYVRGAQDALLAVLGNNNKLARIAGIDTSDKEREDMILSAKAALIQMSPEAEVVYGNPFGDEEFIFDPDFSN